MGGAMAAGCAHFASGVDADGPAREPSDRRYAPLCRNVVEQQRVRLLYGDPRFARRACGSGVSVGTTRLSSHEGRGADWRLSFPSSCVVVASLDRLGGPAATRGPAN